MDPGMDATDGLLTAQSAMPSPASQSLTTVANQIWCLSCLLGSIAALDPGHLVAQSRLTPRSRCRTH
jgi:hypothetical protein